MEIKLNEKTRKVSLKMNEKSLYDYYKESGFLFSKEVLTRYYLSLKTKPFVILTGISGTGKTKIAQVFINYIYQDLTPDQRKNYYAFVPVRPDWTDNRGLLGYYNPLNERYHTTPVLELLLRAKDDQENPYFILLDEMNLAKVEYYFSDFLSIMESRTKETGTKEVSEGEGLLLHNLSDGAFSVGVEKDENKEGDIPPQLPIPPNVFFSGTVNVDESTYMFSPKVLDRANVIEFNEVLLDESDHMQTSDGFVLEEQDVRQDLLLSDGLPFASKDDYDEVKENIKRPILDLFKILEPHHMHFGYRVINEISRFVRLAKTSIPESDFRVALDIQILQKVLPKFHGARGKLETPLRDMLSHFSGAPVDDESVKNGIPYNANAPYPRSAQKCARMLRTLITQGYTSFIES